jgi:hypothetical protein
MYTPAPSGFDAFPKDNEIFRFLETSFLLITVYTTAGSNWATHAFHQS